MWLKNYLYNHLSPCICPVSTDNSAVLVQPVGSATTMPPPTLLLDCTDLRQAHGQGSQATRQSDTPRNMEPHLPSPWAAQAAGSRREGQAGEELGVQRAHESDPLPQTRWEAAGDWHTALHNTRPGRKEGVGGQRKPYAQNYLHFITSIRKAVCKQSKLDRFTSLNESMLCGEFIPLFPSCKYQIAELSHLWCKWLLKKLT